MDIYIISANDKPVKIAHEENLCPVALNFGLNIRCRNAMSTSDGLNLRIYCFDINYCKKFDFNQIKIGTFEIK